MKKKRLIPVLLLKNGWLVQSKSFRRYQNLGNPTTAVKRLSQWGSDELIYLDITKDSDYSLRRNDQNYPNRQTFLEIIEDVSKVTFMPITVGGKISKISDIENRLKMGADKISLNSALINNPKLVSKSAEEFGSQCIVASIDAKLEKHDYYVYNSKNSNIYNILVTELAQFAESLGAGEILLNSVDRDGEGIGYDIELLNKVCEKVNIPIIACGGVSEWSHFKDGLDKSNVDAVAASNIFHYKDQSVYLAKKFLHDNQMNVRKPDLIRL